MGGGRGGKMPSFHIDLRTGRGSSEVGHLNGAVARHGESVGVPAPINAFLSRTLLSLTAGEMPQDAFARKPEALIEAAGARSRAATLR